MSMFHELMMKKKGMPSRYQEVEYIESTGTQYIDTGVMADDTTGLNIEVQSLISTDRILIGSRVAGTDSRFYIGSTANYYIGWNIYNTIEIPYSQKAQISVNFYNNRSVYGDGVFKRYVSGTLATQNSNIVIFGMNSSGSVSSLSSCKMYKVQISKGSRLVRNFIPVYDTLTQKYGMWESVQGKFYGNAGTGDFKGSIVGYTIVGSPTITDGVVSGFSSSNYLQLPSFNPNKLEMLFKVNTGTSTNVLRTLVNTSNNILVIRLRDVNKFEIGIGTGNGNWNIANWISGSKTILANTDYWIKFIYNGNKYILSISENGRDFEDDIIINNPTLFGTINNLILGTRGNYNWQGSIDLNETYIKINNKLWFNGQQA